jgi:hypothetical protein
VRELTSDIYHLTTRWVTVVGPDHGRSQAWGMYDSTAASAGAEAAGLLPSLDDVLLPGCTEDSALTMALARAAGAETAETVQVAREGAYAASASMAAAFVPGESSHFAILESPRGPKRAFACSRAFSTQRSLSLHGTLAHSAPAPDPSHESTPSGDAPVADAGTAAATRARLQTALERNDQWMAKFTKVNRAEHPGVTFHAVWGPMDGDYIACAGDTGMYACVYVCVHVCLHMHAYA